MNLRRWANTILDRGEMPVVLCRDDGLHSRSMTLVGPALAAATSDSELFRAYVAVLVAHRCSQMVDEGSA